MTERSEVHVTVDCSPHAANRSLVPRLGRTGPAATTGWCTSDRAARPVRLAAPGRRPGAAAGAGVGHGRRAAGRAAAGHGQAARPRAARPAPRPRHVRRARASWPTRWTRRCRRQRGTSPPTAWSPGSATIDGRRVAVCAYDFTVHGRLDGRRRRARRRPALRELALRQRIPIVWLLDSAGARIQSTSGLDVRRRRRAVPRAGGDERRRAAGGGHARPLRGRHRLHPGAGRLRPDGEGHVVDGARRPPPRAGGDRRGRHRGGDGRLRGPHQGRRASPTSRSAPTTRVPRRRAPLPVVLPVAQPGGRRRSRADATRSTGGSRSSTTSCRPRRAGPTTWRKVIHGDRRRRRVLPDEAGVGPQHRHRPGPRSAACPSASSPTSRWCSAARST